MTKTVPRGGRAICIGGCGRDVAIALASNYATSVLQTFHHVEYAESPVSDLEEAVRLLNKSARMLFRRMAFSCRIRDAVAPSER